MPDAVQLNVQTAAAILGGAPAAYQMIKLDPNNTCNLHCVYCHIPRSDEVIDLEVFRRFVSERVLGLERFQIGCIMEPTLDRRLSDFMEAVAESPARPRSVFRLQTNGLLLHRHDHARMAAAGLNLLTVSVDSVSAETHRQLRDGASLNRIRRNIAAFREHCPAIGIQTMTTVTTANIDQVDDLIRWGLDSGVTRFELRQMFHRPDSDIVDHAAMRRLAVSDDAFAAMRERVLAAFGDAAAIFCYGADNLLARATTVRANSLATAHD